MELNPNSHTADWWAKRQRLDYSWDALGSMHWEGVVVDDAGALHPAKTVPLPRSGFREATLQDFYAPARHLVGSDGYLQIHRFPGAGAHINSPPFGLADTSFTDIFSAVEKALEQQFPNKRLETLPLHGTVIPELPHALFDGWKIYKFHLQDTCIARLSASMPERYLKVVSSLIIGCNLSGEATDTVEIQNSLIVENVAFERIRARLLSVRGTTFCGRASFASIDIPSAGFDDVIFHDNAGFSSVTVATISFQGCQFQSTFEMFDANVSERTSILRCKFRERATFQNAKLGRSFSCRNSDFADVVELEGADLHADSTFDGTRFSAIERFRAEVIRGENDLTPNRIVVQQNADFKLERLARTFRYMAGVSESARHRADTGKFHRLEMLATRIRQSTPIPDKAMSLAYSWLSDYGSSITRPIVWIAVVFLSTSTALAWPHPSQFGNACRLVTSNVLRPMSVWDPAFDRALSQARDPYLVWVGGTLAGDQFPGLFVRLLLTLNSTLAVVCLFFFALALRRKFELS